MPRTFKLKHKDLTLPTEAESYADGKASGEYWASRGEVYAAGGPFVYKSDRVGNDEAWLEACDASYKNNVAWRNGWADGQRTQRNG